MRNKSTVRDFSFKINAYKLAEIPMYFNNYLKKKSQKSNYESDLSPPLINYH